MLDSMKTRRAGSWALGLGLALASIGLGVAGPNPRAQADTASASDSQEGADVLDHTLDRIDGTPQALADYRGDVALIVNVASKCGLTPQYDGLEALYGEYKAHGFVVLGFPANDFAGQEPGSNAQIADFCRSTYGVEFPMFAKIHVKGPEKHPLYQTLTGLPAPLGGEVEWNFQKYLVDRAGSVVAKFPPRTAPNDPALVERIEELLRTDG